MTKVYRDYTQAELDAQYNQRAWVPHADRILARLAAASDEVRRKLGEPRNERYGASELESLDVYGGGSKAFVFVHGGAWQRESRRASAFAAAPIVEAGAAFVVLGFAALPRVTLPEMVDQVCRGIRWVTQHFDQVVVFGHSSGAHLTACALTQIPEIRKAMLVSGIYDLLPVRLSARNDYVRLDARLEEELSPLRHLDRVRCPVSVACAEKDSAEFRRQSRELADRLGVPLLTVPHLDHFEITESLADPRSPVGRAALTMLQ